MILRLFKILPKGWIKCCGGRGRRTMGSIGGSSGKNTSIKCFMAQVPVKSVCVIPKTEPVHSPIHLPRTLMR